MPTDKRIRVLQRTLTSLDNTLHSLSEAQLVVGEADGEPVNEIIRDVKSAMRKALSLIEKYEHDR